jgi:hypothetical protein
MINSKQLPVRRRNGKLRSLAWMKGVEANEACYDDKALMVFHADTLITEQYYATYRSTGSLAREKSLMLAVMHDAIGCFKCYLGARDKTKRGLFLDAENWILDTERSCFFSFENVCDVLGFDPAYLRAGLMRWKAAAVKNHAPDRSRTELDWIKASQSGISDPNTF